MTMRVVVETVSYTYLYIGAERWLDLLVLPIYSSAAQSQAYTVTT
jgi:hypothetical protein